MAAARPTFRHAVDLWPDLAPRTVTEISRHLDEEASQSTVSPFMLPLDTSRRRNPATQLCIYRVCDGDMTDGPIGVLPREKHKTPTY